MCQMIINHCIRLSVQNPPFKKIKGRAIRIVRDASGVEGRVRRTERVYPRPRDPNSFKLDLSRLPCLDTHENECALTPSAAERSISSLYKKY